MDQPQRSVVWLTAVLSLLVTVNTSSGLHAQDRPTKPIVVENPLIAPPESMENMWSRSDAVLRVRIVSSNPKTVGRDPMHVYTEATAEVLKVFKGRSIVGSVVKFLQVAGEAETPTQIIRVEGATPLPKDHEYVVFLTNSPSAGGLFLSHDVDGAFEIHDGVVIPHGRSAVAQQHQNLSERRFVDELERLRDRHGVVK